MKEKGFYIFICAFYFVIFLENFSSGELFFFLEVLSYSLAELYDADAEKCLVLITALRDIVYRYSILRFLNCFISLSF